MELKPCSALLIPVCYGFVNGVGKRRVVIEGLIWGIRSVIGVRRRRERESDGGEAVGERAGREGGIKAKEN
jgi:hypothetical protein